MKLAAVLIALVTWASAPAQAADAPPGEGKARASKQAQKPGKAAARLAETKKYVIENAAKTAATIKRNAASLAKRLSPDPKAASAATQAQGAAGAKDPKPRPSKQRE